MGDLVCGSTHRDVFYSSYITNCSFNVFLSCVTTILNILTIHALKRTSTLSKPLNTLLLNLAISDLGVGLLLQPFYSALLVRRSQQYIINCTSYGAFIGIVTMFSLASLFGITALSADRFLAIHLHLRYQELVTHKRVVVLVISIWVFSTFLSLAAYTLWISTNITFVLFVIVDAVCMVATTFLNYKIYSAVRRHRIQIQALQVQGAQNGEMVNMARLRKTATGTFYVYLVFLLCYLPQICSYIAFIISGSSRTAIRGWSLYTLTLIFLNSSLNPLIYCWKMRDIRHAIADTLRSLFRIHN